MLLYFDTNVLISALKDEKNVIGRDISTPAIQLIYSVVACRHRIVISTWTKKELSRHFENATALLQVLKPKTKEISYTEKDVEKAREISPEHFHDALHGILAHRAGADFIVTRNVKDFACVRHLVRAQLPEFFV